MISRKHRFKGRGSVQKVRSRASRGPGFSLYTQKSKGPTWRAAVVVSKKVHKSAVVRNRIRRRVYELFRLRDMSAPLGNTDFVCIVHDASIAESDFEALNIAFDKCISYALQQTQGSRTRSRE